MADAGGADALPLLSFTLERLYADYGGEGRLTLAEYQKLGGVKGSIEAAVARAFAEPGRAPAIPAAKDAQLACVRAASIPWLARIAPDTGVPMRRMARLDEIPEGSRAVVERLVAARLLVADRRAGIDVIEVAHESLLRQWSALASWLEADASDLKVVEGVERASSEWGRNGRHEAWLDHRAERLTVAERLTSREDFHRRLGEEGNAYLAACRAREEAEHREKEAALAREQARLAEVAAAQARTARTQRLARWSLAIAGGAVVIGLGLGAWQRSINLALQSSLDSQQAALALEQTNLFVELSIVERLRGNLDAALRFAVDAARLDLQRKPSGASLAGVELATAVLQAGWHMSLGGHERSVSSAAFSPDGSRIVTASQEKTARIWDTATGKQLQVLRGHEAGLWTVVFSPDGSRVLTASEDKTARLWDAATGQQIAVLSGHDDKVTSAAFSPDGRRIVTGSFDKTARIWDAATGQQIAHAARPRQHGADRRFQPGRNAHRHGVRRHHRADLGCRDRAADHGAARNTQERRGLQRGLQPGRHPRRHRLRRHHRTRLGCRDRKGDGGPEGHDDYVNTVDFSPDGTRVLTASADKTARIWDAATGATIAVLQGHEDYVNTAAYSSDGQQIVTASRDQTARVWDAATAAELAILRGHESWVMSAQFSPDGNRAVTASQDKTARIWDAASGHELMALRGHEAALWAATFSSDGTRILTASEDKTARIWDATTGQQLVLLSGHENWVMDAAFSRDGTRVATASWDTTARIWDAASGHQITVLRGHSSVVSSAAFSPDRTRVVTSSRDMTARIWDAATGKELTVLRGHDGGVYAAAASQDRTARVWDAATGKEIASLRGHEDIVWWADFSPDGSRIVTASQDKTARIWDAASAREVAVLRGHESWVVHAAFSPDGSRVITASRDGTARVWNARLPEISIPDLISQACRQRLGRLSTLTRDDMQLAGFPDNAPQVDICAGIE